MATTKTTTTAVKAERTAEQIVTEVTKAANFTPNMSLVHQLIEAKRQKEQEERLMASAERIIGALDRTNQELQEAVRNLRDLRKQEALALEHIKNLDAKAAAINDGRFNEVPELADILGETV